MKKYIINTSVNWKDDRKKAKKQDVLSSSTMKLWEVTPVLNTFYMYTFEWLNNNGADKTRPSKLFK